LDLTQVRKYFNSRKSYNISILLYNVGTRLRGDLVMHLIFILDNDRGFYALCCIMVVDEFVLREFSMLKCHLHVRFCRPIYLSDCNLWWNNCVRNVLVLFLVKNHKKIQNMLCCRRYRAFPYFCPVQIASNCKIGL
jgi:hypothetical protein